jgi:hypothetical protein
MTAEEYYDMQALRSQVNTLIMENGMLKNRCLELERRLKECEDERKEIIQEDTEEKIPPLFIRVVRDFDSRIFAAKVIYPGGRIKVLKTEQVFDSVSSLLDGGYSIPSEFMSLIVVEDRKWKKSE